MPAALKIGEFVRSQYGTHSKVIADEDQEGWVKVKRLSDGAEREWHCSQLRKITEQEANQPEI